MTNLVAVVQLIGFIVQAVVEAASIMRRLQGILMAAQAAGRDVNDAELRQSAQMTETCLQSLQVRILAARGMTVLSEVTIPNGVEDPNVVAMESAIEEARTIVAGLEDQPSDATMASASESPRKRSRG